jgi:hypothetical protein
MRRACRLYDRNICPTNLREPPFGLPAAQHPPLLLEQNGEHLLCDGLIPQKRHGGKAPARPLRSRLPPERLPAQPFPERVSLVIDF